MKETTSKEPKWDKKKAPIVKDEDSLLDRQRSRLAERKRVSVEALYERVAAREKELADQRANSRFQIVAAISQPTTITERVANAASSYVSCLSMHTEDPTRLKQLMDEIEDLPHESPIRVKLEPLVSDLLTCKDFMAGKLLHAHINS